MKNKHKKKDEIYCLLPHHVKLEHCKSKYDAVLAWSPNIDDIREAMDTLEFGDECDLFIGNLKDFRKESYEQCESTELIYYKGQWIQRAYIGTLRRMICEQRDAFNTTIGVMACILDDKEELDRGDRKILKKAMSIIQTIRDTKPDPITMETIQLEQELDREYRDRIQEFDRVLVNDIFDDEDDDL